MHENIRFLFLAFMALVGLASPAMAADKPTDPVAAMYRAAIASSNQSAFENKTLRTRYFTASFRSVAESIGKRKTANHDAIIDFDPILNMNGDGDAKNLVILTEQEQGGHARVKAIFGTGKERRSLVYTLARDAGSWRIDDIQGVPAANTDETWSICRMSDEDLAMRAKKSSGNWRRDDLSAEGLTLAFQIAGYAKRVGRP